MRGMILAAGRGERMGELTRETPKPLLRVGDRYLIEYAILNFKRAGILDIMINISYHAEKIKQALGSGGQYGVRLCYSEEATRLETGGGIYQALPWFNETPFVVVSADVITDFPLQTIVDHRLSERAHLVVVPNPAYHPEGDFMLVDGRLALPAKQGDLETFTFANIGLYHPQLFAACQPGYFRLADVLFPAIQRNQISGEVYDGLWHNIGTPDDFCQAQRALASCALDR